MGLHTRYWYLSHPRGVKAQTSLRTCAVSSEPSLLAYTKYGSRGGLRPKFKHLTPLDTPVCAFKGGICAYAISTTISYYGLYIPFGKQIVSLSFHQSQECLFVKSTRVNLSSRRCRSELPSFLYRVESRTFEYHRTEFAH